MQCSYGSTENIRTECPIAAGLAPKVIPTVTLEFYKAHWKGQMGDFDLCHRIGPLKTKSNALVVLKDDV